MGSILGVVCGLGVSVFSKPLAVLIGLGVFVLQVSLCLFCYEGVEGRVTVEVHGRCDFNVVV